MSDSKMVTEREAVIRERVAYLRGAASQAICSHKGPDCDMCRRTAALEYPLPKVTRPRVVQDSTGIKWRIRGDVRECHVIEYAEQFGAERWRDILMAGGPGTPGMTVERARLIADLSKNPTEEVEADI